jgi:hypothetical protein
MTVDAYRTGVELDRAELDDLAVRQSICWSAATAEGLPAVGREHLLSTLTLYWVKRPVGSSLLPYWNYQHSRGGALPSDDPAPTPTAIDLFGGEPVQYPKPPRDLAQRYFNVVRWAEHDVGGHFPAVAPQPAGSMPPPRVPAIPRRREHTAVTRESKETPPPWAGCGSTPPGFS